MLTHKNIDITPPIQQHCSSRYIDSFKCNFQVETTRCELDDSFVHAYISVCELHIYALCTHLHRTIFNLHGLIRKNREVFLGSGEGVDR